MIKTVLTVVAVSSFLALPVFAKRLNLPNEESAVATIEMPNSWEPEEITNGFAGTSPDRAVYMAVVAVGSDKGREAELDDTFDMLKEQKVVLDKSSKSEDKVKINGVEVNEITYRGKDEDGPAAVSIAFVPMKDKVIVVTYWVSSDEKKGHQAEVGKILNSLQAGR